MVVVNDCYRLWPQAHHLWATDHRWVKHHVADIARDFEGRCWTVEVAWPKESPPEAWGFTALKADTQAKSLSKDPAIVHTGHNSGFAAVGLAYTVLRAQRILLLGYDMQLEGDRRHWFGAHPGGMEVNSNYAQFMAHFASIDCTHLGLEIWNVTRSTALTCFPIYNLDDL